MAVSARDLREMARQLLGDACSTPDNWMELLGNIAPFYKYDFESAALISAQRPDATACATMQAWNRRNLWIRKGSKAIYTLDPQNPYHVQRVFDISDINASPERLPPVWQLREEQRGEVFNRLAQEWEVDADEGNEAITLYEGMLNSIADFIPEYRAELEEARSMGMMADLTQEDAEIIFSSMAGDSAYYMAMKRLNIPLPDDFTSAIYENVDLFDTPELQMLLATATHEIGASTLRQVERVTKVVQREEAARILASSQESWNNMFRQAEGLAGSLGGGSQTAQRQTGYNKGVAEEILLSTEEAKQIKIDADMEREDEHGTQETGTGIQGGPGRDARPGAGIPEAADGQRGQVRRDAQEVPSGSSQGDLREPASGGNAESAPDGSERAGESDGGADHRGAVEKQSRTGQGDGYAGLGAAYEQPEASGGGNHSERSDLRIIEEPRPLELDEPFSSFSMPINGSGQISMFAAMPISIPQALVDQVLADGSNRRNSTYRIVARVKKDMPLEQNAAFLQREYGIGGKGFIVDGKKLAVWWNAEGISMAYGDTAQTEEAMRISWLQAAKRVRELLDTGRYMSNGELDMVDYNERHELAQQLWYVYRDDLHRMPEEWKSPQRHPSEDEALIMESLADPAQREPILTRLVADIEAADLEEPQHRRWHNTNRLVEELRIFQRPQLTFTATQPVKLSVSRFITQDEIDLELGSGSRVEGGKGRIYRYFQEAHTAKEQADFLKKEYGIGGHSHAVGGADNAWCDHDSSGITIKRDSPSKSETKVILKWPQVAKRIGELIAQGRYLSAEAIEQLRQEDVEKSIELPAELPPKPYELGYGEKGNGTTVWNRLEEQDGDYRTVAHISEEGIVSIYDTDLPPQAVDEIHTVADRQRIRSQTAPNPEQWLEDKLVELGDMIVQSLQEEDILNQFREYMPDESQLQAVFENTLENSIAEALAGDVDGNAAYLENSDFQKRLAEYVLERSYVEPEESQQPAATAPPKRGMTYREQNYRALDALMPGLLNGERDYIKMEAGPSFMRLVGEQIDEDVISLAHYYEQNGDLMRDPEITLRVDRERGELIPLSFQQDNMGLYYEAQSDRQERELTSFMHDWLRNIRSQGYQIVGEKEQLPEESNEIHIPLRTEFEMDGHRFRVNAVNYDTACVELQDLDMFASGYPLFRNEAIEAVYPLITEKLLPNGNNFEKMAEKEEKTKEVTLEDTVLSSDEPVKLKSVVIDLRARETQEPVAPAGNYRIHDDHLGEGGTRTKADRNIEAIRVLQRIEAEQRPASRDEQEALAQYVGWGGIPQIFDEANADWKERRDTLRSLLTDEEYNAARASTLNAHYTAPIVIRSIYQALENMGFKQGTILEPSCGVGNFFGMLPEAMQESKLYGVELDSITGRIAQKLYPDAQIAVQGFEHSSLPDDFFDTAVGNVPFGSYSLADSRYDRFHFRIHDYFFAKTLDKVRRGGVVAFVTSKGTLDKQDSSVRRYIAQRAELLGAIRLPNNAFQKNAGTEVTSDILFLQKRERPMDIVPSWVDVGRNDEGLPVNQYFLDHPEMMLGTMASWKNMYGNENETACLPIPDADLSQQLSEAITHIQGRYEAIEREQHETGADKIPADPTVPNFSFAICDGQVYYRRDEWMEKCELNTNDEIRVRSMIGLRDLTRELIQAQLAGASDEEVGTLQMELKERYEAFSSRFGLLSDRRNAQVFREDDGYYLLTSLEILDENHNLERLADMFTRRTIAQNLPIDHVETAAEALAVSMAECAKVDLDYMSDLTGMDKDKLISDLQGLIFQEPYGNPPSYENWQTADEYLSGDVRQKLKRAELGVELIDERFQVNVDALRAVQPKDLEPHEIDVRLGATWIPTQDIEDFVHELLGTPFYMRGRIKVEYAAQTGVWHITNKGLDHDNDRVNTQYGTGRRNAYKIIEESLNLRDVRVFDVVEDEYGKEKRVLNQKETILAQQKQTAIREAFVSWVWKKPERTERLCRLYNDTYNCIRLREYDGQHLRFVGMNPELQLRPHQKNAVARILYGGNTLLAHCVGAGKTAVMIASIMEKKRIGLGHKALLAVPNHLTEQTAAEFLRFYPGAKILVTTKRDFEKQNRKNFIGRIATGDYDAIIMGHSQFEKIPVSKERQKQMLEEQIQEIMDDIKELKYKNDQKFSVKEMERTRKSLEARLKKLNSDENKDAVVTFEELGIDMLYVDEAHGYKNLAVVTKMRNVAGINTTEAKKSSDMYMKTRYLVELTDNRGVVFATGTPVSNSMTELYTMQRYLQGDELLRRNLSHFDSWAATFGETQTAIELAPEGTGYRLKTRFSKFFNLPELMSMFKQVADIQTPDMLKLPVPELKGGATQNIRTEASEYQHEMVAELAERADSVRKGMVNPHEDNMLKITNDGRLLALDARLIDPTLPDDPNSKVNTCVRETLRIYGEGDKERLTQLVFCDLSTPKAERTDGIFDDVYHDIRRKLIRGGIPEAEIAFIHDADTEAKKDELFAKVRSGAVRILIGSTAKMGAGTNVQTRLKALHHLDCPWRPSDLQQRDGRILRQGNTNREVEVIRYVTQDTFDAYSYQLVENKQKFISQIFTSKSPVRGAEDLDEMALSYAEVKALAAGNPAIREKMDLDVQVARLKLLRSNWQSERYHLENRVNVDLPGEIARLENRIRQETLDIQRGTENKPSNEDGFCITLMDRTYDKRADAGEQLMRMLSMVQVGDSMKLGEYCGFTLRATRPSMLNNPRIEIQGEGSYQMDAGESDLGNITRIENVLERIANLKKKDEESLGTAREQLENAKEELGKPWPKEQEYQEKTARLTQLNLELDVGGGDQSAAALADDDEPEEQHRSARNRVQER